MSKSLLAIIVLAVAILLSGCMESEAEREKRKWSISMQHTDKRPYGSYLAYESLKFFFPSAHISPLSSGARFNNLGSNMIYNNADGRKLLVLTGFQFRLSEDEWSELKRFVANGNEIVLFSSWLDKQVEKDLNIESRYGADDVSVINDKWVRVTNKDVLSVKSMPGRKFGYKGRTIKTFFALNTTYTPVGTTTVDTAAVANTDNETVTDASDSGSYAYDSTTTGADSSYTGDDNYDDAPLWWSTSDTLGYVYDTSINFVRYSLGEGHITLHAAPLSISNYFLLQSGNEQYLSAIWQTLPNDINHIYWCDYFQRSVESSSSDILWKYPSTKLALIIALITLLIYILFEGKRKQRIIPVLPPLKNDSVSFVETVGRLYYNKGDHANLAEKMIQQFLEWVRTYYFLNTNVLNEGFIQQLIIKSGQHESTVRALMDMVHEIRLKNALVDDAYLYQLYNTIQQFYKNHRI